MADLITKEIKGISARNLIALLSSVIFIEFTILMSYNALTTTAKENRDRVIHLEQTVDKLNDKVMDLQTRISIIESKTKF